LYSEVIQTQKILDYLVRYTVTTYEGGTDIVFQNVST